MSADMDVVLEVEDIVLKLNGLRSILNFAKDQLQRLNSKISGYKHCHERPKFDFMIVDGLLSQRSHLFGQLVEAGRKRVLYSNMVKLVSYHQELNKHDY